MLVLPVSLICQRGRESCHNRGTSQAVCDELCACTIEALFTGRSDAELQRLTAEGLYGTLSRETNQLLGALGARTEFCRDLTLR